jgi:hypothetical protein
VARLYWLMGLHLDPRLSRRSVSAKVVGGLRTVRDNVADSSRHEQPGREGVEKLFQQCASPGWDTGSGA